MFTLSKSCKKLIGKVYKQIARGHSGCKFISSSDDGRPMS